MLHVIFGDLFLQDIRVVLGKAALAVRRDDVPVFPLWGRLTPASLARRYGCGRAISAFLTCVDPRQLDRGRLPDSGLTPTSWRLSLGMSIPAGKTESFTRSRMRDRCSIREWR